jgi:hypothetical protein
MGNFMKCGAAICSRIFESFNLGHSNKVLGRDIESLCCRHAECPRFGLKNASARRCHVNWRSATAWARMMA